MQARCPPVCPPLPRPSPRPALAGAGDRRAGAGPDHDGNFDWHGCLCGAQLQAARRHADVSAARMHGKRHPGLACRPPRGRPRSGGTPPAGDERTLGALEEWAGAGPSVGTALVPAWRPARCAHAGWAPPPPPPRFPVAQAEAGRAVRRPRAAGGADVRDDDFPHRCLARLHRQARASC